MQPHQARLERGGEEREGGVGGVEVEPVIPLAVKGGRGETVQAVGRRQ